MADELIYNRVSWEDAPSENTPIDAENLNKMDKGIADVTEFVNQLSEQIDDMKENGTGGGSGTGTDGKDGFSPIATVTQTDTGAVISIQDANGTTTAEIFHGENGEDGYTPVKGTDYLTTEDKNELVNLVLNALPTWTGGSY